jgi:hypothetical protein
MKILSRALFLLFFVLVGVLMPSATPTRRELAM